MTTDRPKRVRDAVPPTDDTDDSDDVEGHGRWDLPGDEQPRSASSATSPDPEGRA